MRTSDFDYDLPEGRIARYPVEDRAESRLLVLPREGDGAIDHLRFSQLPSLLSPGDVLVLNESRVLPARLLGRKPTGAPAEILLLRPHQPSAAGGSERSEATPAATASGIHWEALVRPGSKLKPGRRVVIGPELEVAILDSTPENGRVVRLETDLTLDEALERYGHMPLPPYLDREDEPLDRERYQTVYAREPGSVAAPTAGLHFTSALLAEIEAKGVEIARVTLHVGPGTFRPVDTEDPTEHPMHTEWYEVPDEAADAINAVLERRSTGGRDEAAAGEGPGPSRIWAVGTTVVRTLESAVEPESGSGASRPRISPGPGTTDLFIAPGFDFRVVDGLITNFHLPRSTLLMLVAAFAGRERVLAAYDEAVKEGYRFYSYGDAMAIC